MTDYQTPLSVIVMLSLVTGRVL